MKPHATAPRRRGLYPPVTVRRFLLLLLLSLSPFFSIRANEDWTSFARPLTVRWHYLSDQTVNLTPAFDETSIYLPLTTGRLVTLQASTGQLLWRAETGGEFSASPVADERGVYIASEIMTGAQNNHTPATTGAVRVLGTKSGVTLWMRTLPVPLRGALAHDGEMLFGAGDDGRILAIRKINGEILWVKQLAAPFASHPMVLGDRLYLGDEHGSLFALERTTGRTVWHYRTRGALRGRVSIAAGVVYFGSADGYVYALNERDGSLRWRVRTGAEVQAVLHVPNRGLIVASLDNFVYLLSPRRGDRLWKRQLAGRIAAQPLATRDSALFAPLAADAGVVLNLLDGKQVNALPIGDDNTVVASPVVTGGHLLLTTRRGLFAFTSDPPVAARVGVRAIY